MTTRPVIFISAVSSELKTARQAVANCLTSLGYSPEWQDIFATESGSLLQMLRQKVDRAAAVVQIAGQCYGAEPDAPPPGFPRCSYTQYEALYALSRKKPVYYITLGSAFPADPRDPEPDELRDLQSAYIKTIEATGHLRHPAATAADLENKVLRLRDDFAKLRRRTLQWAAALTFGILAIAGGVTWLILRQQQQADTAVRTEQKTDLLLKVLREYPNALAESASFDKSQSESSRLAAAFRRLEEKHQLPPGSLEKDLPLFATQLLLQTDTSALDRANALLVQKKFVEAETAALTAKDEALRAAPEVAARAIEALETAAWAATGQIQYDRALQHYQAAAALTDQTRDPAEWARVQHAIAYVFALLGRGREAEPVLRAVLTVQQRDPGPEHPDTLASRNNFAAALRSQGKLTEAEAEHRAVLTLRQRILGPEHPDTLSSLSNLANTLQEQGKNAEAEAEHHAVLAVRQRLFGSDHPDTLTSRNNLAVVLQEQGKHAEAAAEHRAVHTLMERLHGPDHPDTLTSRSNLANTLGAQRRNAEAEAEHRAVLAVRQRILGPEHPDTLTSRTNLAAALAAQGKYAQEEAELRAVLIAWERVLGPEHPYTLLTHHNLALCFMAQKKPQEARAEAAAAHAGWLKVLGANHPDTMDAKKLLDRLPSAP